ncbi:MAG: EF-P lysine aminoacylase GenX [Bdellovibrionales bacterium]|nr:EF-P lysine aminoacylase GenX [Bdellovibrionales bacterium]
MSDKVEILKKRHEAFRAVRRFFETRNFIEVHTPTLVINPGLEPQLLPFETQFEPAMGGGRRRTFYLPTSPEYHLKKALALGLPRVFEIAKSFRNGEISRTHEPEFHMLEWYRHPGSYHDIAQDFRELLAELGAQFAPAAPWALAQNLSVHEAFQKYCGLDLEGALLGTSPSLTAQAVRAGFASVHADDDFDTCFHKLIVEQIERKLGHEGPLFLWNYPASLSALSRPCPNKPHLCERFEVYWRGLELANAFGELTDAAEQRRRCLTDIETRTQIYGKSPPLDESFLQALEQLSHPAGGIAVGLDRLIQSLLGLPSVQEVIAFPHADSL